MGDDPMGTLWGMALQAESPYGAPMGTPMIDYGHLWGMVLWRPYGAWHFRLGVPMESLWSPYR
jgi:hypothetical protein